VRTSPEEITGPMPGFMSCIPLIPIP
jgi:hypothetical protein